MQLVLPKNKQYVRTKFKDAAPIIGTCTNRVELLPGQDPDIQDKHVERENEQWEQRVKYMEFTKNLEQARPDWKSHPAPCAVCWSRLLFEAGVRLTSSDNEIMKDKLPKDVFDIFKSTATSSA